MSRQIIEEFLQYGLLRKGDTDVVSYQDRPPGEFCPERSEQNLLPYRIRKKTKSNVLECNVLVFNTFLAFIPNYTVLLQILRHFKSDSALICPSFDIYVVVGGSTPSDKYRLACISDPAITNQDLQMNVMSARCVEPRLLNSCIDDAGICMDDTVVLNYDLCRTLIHNIVCGSHRLMASRFLRYGYEELERLAKELRIYPLRRERNSSISMCYLEPNNGSDLNMRKINRVLECFDEILEYCCLNIEFHHAVSEEGVAKINALWARHEKKLLSCQYSISKKTSPAEVTVEIRMLTSGVMGICFYGSRYLRRINLFLGSDNTEINIATGIVNFIYITQALKQYVDNNPDATGLIERFYLKVRTLKLDSYGGLTGNLLSLVNYLRFYNNRGALRRMTVVSSSRQFAAVLNNLACLGVNTFWAGSSPMGITILPAYLNAPCCPNFSFSMNMNRDEHPRSKRELDKRWVLVYPVSELKPTADIFSPKNLYNEDYLKRVVSFPQDEAPTIIIVGDRGVMKVDVPYPRRGGRGWVISLQITILNKHSLQIASAWLEGIFMRVPSGELERKRLARTDIIITGCGISAINRLKNFMGKMPTGVAAPFTLSSLSFDFDIMRAVYEKDYAFKAAERIFCCFGSYATEISVSFRCKNRPTAVFRRFKPKLGPPIFETIKKYDQLERCFEEAPPRFILYNAAALDSLDANPRVSTKPRNIPQEMFDSNGVPLPHTDYYNYIGTLNEGLSPLGDLVVLDGVAATCYKEKAGLFAAVGAKAGSEGERVFRIECLLGQRGERPAPVPIPGYGKDRLIAYHIECAGGAQIPKENVVFYKNTTGQYYVRVEREALSGASVIVFRAIIIAETKNPHLYTQFEFKKEALAAYANVLRLKPGGGFAPLSNADDRRYLEVLGQSPLKLIQFLNVYMHTFKDRPLEEASSDPLILANQLFAAKVGVCAHRCHIFTKIFLAMKETYPDAYTGWFSYIAQRTQVHSRVLVIAPEDNRYCVDLGGGELVINSISAASKKATDSGVQQTKKKKELQPLKYFTSYLERLKPVLFLSVSMLVNHIAANKTNPFALLKVENVLSAYRIISQLCYDREFFVAHSSRDFSPDCRRETKTGEVVACKPAIEQALHKGGILILSPGMLSSNNTGFINKLLDEMQTAADTGESNEEEHKVNLPAKVMIIMVALLKDLKGQGDDFHTRFGTRLLKPQIGPGPRGSAAPVTEPTKLSVDLMYGLRSLYQFVTGSLSDKLSAGPCELTIYNPPKNNTVEWVELMQYVRTLASTRRYFFNGAFHLIKPFTFIFKNKKYNIKSYGAPIVGCKSTDERVSRCACIVTRGNLRWAIDRYSQAENKLKKNEGWLVEFRGKPVTLLVTWVMLKYELAYLLEMAKSIDCRLTLLLVSDKQRITPVVDTHTEGACASAAASAGASASVSASHSRSRFVKVYTTDQIVDALRYHQESNPEASMVLIHDLNGLDLFYHVKEKRYYKTELFEKLERGETVIIYGPLSMDLTELLIEWGNMEQMPKSLKFTGRLIVITADKSVASCLFSTDSPKIPGATKAPMSAPGLNEATLIHSRVTVFKGGVNTGIRPYIASLPESRFKLFSDVHLWLRATPLTEEQQLILWIPYADSNPDQINMSWIAGLHEGTISVMGGEQMIVLSPSHRVVACVERPCELLRYMAPIICPPLGGALRTLPAPDKRTLAIALKRDYGQFLLTPSRVHLIVTVEMLLNEHKNPSSNIHGIKITGQSQAGKSASLGIIKQYNPGFNIVSLKVSTDENMCRQVEDAYQNAKILWVDEINTFFTYPKFWHLLQKRLEIPNTENPGFFMLATQNPSSYKGRRNFPTGCVLDYILKDYSLGELASIARRIDPSFDQDESLRYASDFLRVYRKLSNSQEHDKQRLTPRKFFEELRTRAVTADVNMGSAGAAASASEGEDYNSNGDAASLKRKRASSYGR